MNLKLSLLSFFAIILLSSNSIWAQVTAPVFKPSHLKAAEQYLAATGMSTQFEGVIGTMITASSAQIPEAQRGEFINVMKAFMAKYYTWDILKGQYAAIYATEFTEPELNQLAAFYNSPLGKKASSKTTLLMQKGMAIGQQVVAEHRPELEQMMKDAFDKTEPAAKQ